MMSLYDKPLLWSRRSQRPEEEDDGCPDWAWCSYFIHTPSLSLIVSWAGKCGSGWLPPSSMSSLHVTNWGLSLADTYPTLSSDWSIEWHGGGVEAMPGGSADNVKTAAFFVCDFYKIWWATIYTWITFKTVRASDQALNWLDVKYLCVQSISCM